MQLSHCATACSCIWSISRGPFFNLAACSNKLLLYVCSTRAKPANFVTEALDSYPIHVIVGWLLRTIGVCSHARVGGQLFPFRGRESPADHPILGRSPPTPRYQGTIYIYMYVDCASPLFLGEGTTSILLLRFLLQACRNM